MRLAFFTPLNPEPSGISDYSEELLPSLAELAEIDLVIGPYEPTTESIRRRFRILRAEEFLRSSRSYDAVVYQVGNNYRCHEYMLPCLSVAPGIVVLHDYSLTYLMLPLTIQRGDFVGLKHILEPSYGPRARSVATRLLFSLVDPYEVSLARPVVEMSRGVIVHNRYSLNRVQADFPGKPARLILHATPARELPRNIAGLRASYGFTERDFILASVSTLAYNKRIDMVLDAVRQLLDRYPNVKLLLVGQGQLGSRARALIRANGLEGIVRHTGWVSSQAYQDYIDLADVVVDIRRPTAGETSGSSLRAIQSAKPLVVSAEGFFLELPDACCIRLPAGPQEPQALIDAVSSLIDDPRKCLAMGRAGRDFALTELGHERAARAYIDFASEIIACQPASTADWKFRADGSGVSGRVLNLAYAAGRIRHHIQRYGVADTLKRIQAQTQ